MTLQTLATVDADHHAGEIRKALSDAGFTVVGTFDPDTGAGELTVKLPERFVNEPKMRPDGSKVTPDGSVQ